MVTQSSGKKYHGTLTKKLFRDMSRSAMQFLAMFLLCAMGTWCFSGLDANWRMLELSTETPIAQSNLADFWVKGASFGKNDILKLRNLTGVKDVQARVTLEMDCPDLGDEVTLMVHGYDGDMRICTPIIRTGSELSASDTRGCLLEEQFAQAHNLSVGDTVKVSYGGVSLTFFVRGTILSGEYLVTAKNITPQPDIYGYMYVSAKAMAAFPFTEMLVKASSDADLTQVRAEIMNTCPTALIVDKDTHSGTLSARNFVSMFRSLSYLFPVLVFAVAAMIVVNTLTRMIENQRVQMGTLKALGYRDRQIRLHYLSYAIVPSVAGSLLGVLTGLRFGWGARLLIELAFIWIVTWIACYPVCDSILILNISAAIKMLLALTVGVLGIVYVARSGFVNDMAPRTFLPGFDLHSLSYISVIIFNFLGFEVVCTYADNMRDPKRQIPQAIVSGGIVIALIYLFSAFGIGAAIPTQEISEDSGLIDAVSLMTGRTSGWFVGAVALLFLITLFGNMISWSMGVNATAAYAAARVDMPAVFSRRWAKNDMPVGAALTSGVVASAVCILGVVIELLSPASSLFWSFFALNLVMLLLSYVPVFPAFLRLRARDPDAERPFRVPGGRGLLRALAYVPMALILISIFFTAVPLSMDSETLSYYLPITVGSLISIAIGEVLIAARARRRP